MTHQDAAPKTVLNVAPTYIAIAGRTDVFPVRRIYCIGRNYAAHAREMGSDPTREPPFFFQKPTDAVQLAPPSETIDHPYPTLTKNYHTRSNWWPRPTGGRDIARAGARPRVVAIGLDATRRDLQRAMGDEEAGEIGRHFDRSRRRAPLTPPRRGRSPGAIWLRVNGGKQNANLNQMIWNVAEQIAGCPRRSN
jgi:2-keto-4-pentenoate hydratase/2-oxohepta-3-ene-1,7-dioic acid hydratase in catechol pathway